MILIMSMKKQIIQKIMIQSVQTILLNSINTIQVDIPVGITNFYVIDIFTSFFLCLKNIDILKIYLNNITNQLICQDSKNIVILYKWGHPWFFVNKYKKMATSIFLLKAEPCQIYSRFRYFLVIKLHKLLT